MPALVYSVGDFQAFTKIKSADVNAKYNDIQTLLNTTKLNDFNIQDGGITRSTKLTAGTAQSVVINGAAGAMSELTMNNGELLSKASGSIAVVAAGNLGQLLQSTGAGVPTWIDAPFALPSHYIKSGAATADRQQDFIRPDGSGADDFTIVCTTTSLVVVIENTEYTFTNNINVTGLDPIATITANITATVNDATLADELWTKQVGELDAPIVLDGVGSEIVSKAGGLAAFRLTTGASSEYFIGRINLAAASGSAEITDCRRGYFVDDTGAPIPRIVFADNDTVTIMNLYWVFLDSNGTAHTTTLEPTYSDAEPLSPTTGQYWFDYGVSQWKRYDGAAFQVVSRLPIGQVIVDENDEVVGARAFDFFSQTAADNTVVFADYNDTLVKSGQAGEINVKGNLFRFNAAGLVFDVANTTQQMVVTEAASTWYYLYITDVGDLKIDDVAPYNRDDLQGRYHPHKPWRNVGMAYNNASSNLAAVFDTRADCDISKNTYVASVTASPTPPAKGTTPYDQGRFAKQSNRLYINYTIDQSTAGTLGNGIYLWSMPPGLILSRELLVTGALPAIGSYIFTSGSGPAVGHAAPGDNNGSNFRAIATNQSAAGQVGSALFGFNSAQAHTFELTSLPTRQFSSKDLR